MKYDTIASPPRPLLSTESTDGGGCAGCPLPCKPRETIVPEGNGGTSWGTRKDDASLDYGHRALHDSSHDSIDTAGLDAAIGHDADYKACCSSARFVCDDSVRSDDSSLVSAPTLCSASPSMSFADSEDEETPLPGEEEPSSREEEEQQQQQEEADAESSPETNPEAGCESGVEKGRRKSGIWNHVVRDFDRSRGGDFKILRAIGRTAAVNAVVSATALVGGPVAGVAGYATGGAITAKRLFGDGIAREDHKEIAKSLAVFGGATTASLTGQAIAGAAMIGLVGASLPVAGAVAFSAGCVSGITAGALSEWGVDGFMGEGREKQAAGSGSDPKGGKIDSGGGNAETKHGLAGVVGAWVDRQRQRRRESRVDREAARIKKLVDQQTSAASEHNKPAWHGRGSIVGKHSADPVVC